MVVDPGVVAADVELEDLRAVRRLGGRLQAGLAHRADDVEDAEFGRRLGARGRSEEHTSALQSLMRISYAVFCLKKNKRHNIPPRRDIDVKSCRTPMRQELHTSHDTTH